MIIQVPIECLICVKHYAKCFTYRALSDSYTNSVNYHTHLMGKLKVGKVECLAKVIQIVMELGLEIMSF